MLTGPGCRALLPLADSGGFPRASLAALDPHTGCWTSGWSHAPRSAAPPPSWLSTLGRGLLGALSLVLLLLTFPVSIWFAVKVVPAYERLVVFRLGRLRRPLGPGLVLLLPGVDSARSVDLRPRAFSVPPCQLTCKDGAVLSVGADVQFRIRDPVLSVMAVQDLNAAARVTARNVVTRALLRRPLREVQAERLRIGEQLLVDMNEVTLAWGLEVGRVELLLEAVLQPPPEDPALDTLQLALHLLGVHPNPNPTGHPRPGPDTVELVSETGGTPIPEPLVTEGLLSTLRPKLSEALVSQVGACFQLNLVLPGGARDTCFLDLTAGQGQLGRGPPQAPPDVVVEVAEADLQALLRGELWPLGAYVSGRLRVEGDLAVALRLEAVLRSLR